MAIDDITSSADVWLTTAAELLLLDAESVRVLALRCFQCTDTLGDEPCARWFFAHRWESTPAANTAE